MCGIALRSDQGSRRERERVVLFVPYHAESTLSSAQVLKERPEPPSYVYANSGCVAAKLTGCLVSLFVSVCRSCGVVIICLASTHTALVSSPSLAVLHLPVPSVVRGSFVVKFFTFLEHLSTG